jgi:cellulose synthase/poly-beta-1,6-N-acetylglucosamine synthase-like glycosyltransferase
MNPGLLGFLLGLGAGGTLALVGEAKNRRTLRHLRRGKARSLSILIASRNEEDVIENTIRTMAENAPPETEIIVVDGSTDSTPQILARLAQEIPSLKVLPDPYRKGKPAALNYALQHVRGEIVLFMDADARMDKEGLRFYPEVLSGSNLPAVFADFSSYNTRRSWVVEAQEYLFSFSRRLVFPGIFWRPVFMTCGLFVRKEALEKAGEFKQKTLVDDFDLGIRLAKMGIKVPFVRGPRCLIQYSPTLRDLFYQFLRWYTGGIQEMKEEIKKGGLSYLLLMMALALVIYFPRWPSLWMGCGGNGFWCPSFCPDILGFFGLRPRFPHFWKSQGSSSSFGPSPSYTFGSNLRWPPRFSAPFSGRFLGTKCSEKGGEDAQTKHCHPYMQ